MTKIIKLSTINEIKDLMGDGLIDMIKYFLEDTEKYIKDIQEGIENENIQTISMAAHTIKSSAKQLGADRLSDVAMNIEKLTKNLTKDIQKIVEFNIKLQKEFALAKPELEKLCANF